MLVTNYEEHNCKVTINDKVIYAKVEIRISTENKTITYSEIKIKIDSEKLKEILNE